MRELEKARLAHELLERAAARRHPLVQAVLEMFPGSEVVEVRMSPKPKLPTTASWQDTVDWLRARGRLAGADKSDR